MRDGSGASWPGGRSIAIIEAPSNLGLMPPAPGREPGTGRAPAALRLAGLHDLLRPVEVVRVDAPPYDPDDERSVNVRNLAAIAAYTTRLAEDVSRALDCGWFPLIIGGDCSILLGPTLALRRRGAYGLVFIDGHTDFFLPEQSVTGGAAGMDLALATGWGPAELTDIDGMRPYVRIENVVAVGNRDHAARPPAMIPPLAESGAPYFDLATVRAMGIDTAVNRGLDAIRTRATDGVWLHVDVDVLDGDVMPAVDSPQPGGLSYEELILAVRTAIRSNAVIGMEVTIFDPDQDLDGRLARNLCEALADCLGGFAPSAKL